MNPKIVKRREKQTISVKTTCPISELPRFLNEAFFEVVAFIRKNRIIPAGPPFALYYSDNMEALEVEAGIPVFRPKPAEGKVQPGRLPAGTYGYARHKGAYAGLKDTYDSLAAFIAQQGYEPAGLSFEMFVKDPSRTPVNRMKTDVFFLLKEL